MNLGVGATSRTLVCDPSELWKQTVDAKSETRIVSAQLSDAKKELAATTKELEIQKVKFAEYEQKCVVSAQEWSARFAAMAEEANAVTGDSDRKVFAAQAQFASVEQERAGLERELAHAKRLLHLSDSALLVLQYRAKEQATKQEQTLNDLLDAQLQLTNERNNWRSVFGALVLVVLVFLVTSDLFGGTGGTGRDNHGNETYYRGSL